MKTPFDNSENDAPVIDHRQKTTGEQTVAQNKTPPVPPKEPMVQKTAPQKQSPWRLIAACAAVAAVILGVVLANRNHQSTSRDSQNSQLYPVIPESTEATAAPEVYTDEEGYTHEKFYDQDGNLVRHCLYQSDGQPLCVNEYTVGSDGNSVLADSVEYVYDGDGKLVGEETYSAEGELLTCGEYAYDSNGDRYTAKISFYSDNNVIAESHFHSDGTEYISYEYDYDSDGRLTEECIYDSSGVLSARRTYDANGNPTASYTYSLDGALDWWYEYTYDEYGNRVNTTYHSGEE